MTKIFMGLCALLVTTLVTAEPIEAPKLDDVKKSVQNGVDSIVINLNLTGKSQRDLLTFAIGGAAGFAAGGLVSGLGLLRVDALGMPVVPIASGLVGIYLANVGYFDKLRGMVW
ncbi:exported hypothetical protein [Gammaproteobacteria bacterium]